jgi:hypothetical protein
VHIHISNDDNKYSRDDRNQYANVIIIIKYMYKYM